MKNGSVLKKDPPAHGNTRKGRTNMNGAKSVFINPSLHRRAILVATHRDEYLHDFIETLLKTHLPTFEAEIRNGIQANHHGV